MCSCCLRGALGFRNVVKQDTSRGNSFTHQLVRDESVASDMQRTTPH